MSLDTRFYYRLTRAFLGVGHALDVKSDGSGLLMMAPTADHSGQVWRLVDVGGGKYALRTLYLGDCFSLDVINDGTNNTTAGRTSLSSAPAATRGGTGR